MFFQDFIAAFYIYLRSRYTLLYTEKDDNDFDPEFVKLTSKIQKSIFGIERSETKSEITIRNNKKINIVTSFGSQKISMTIETLQANKVRSFEA